MSFMNYLNFNRSCASGRSVVMFTAKENEVEQFKSYDLGVNGYIIKPMNFKNLSETVRSLNEFWNLAAIPEDC